MHTVLKVLGTLAEKLQLASQNPDLPEGLKPGLDAASVVAQEMRAVHARHARDVEGRAALAKRGGPYGLPVDSALPDGEWFVECRGLDGKAIVAYLGGDEEAARVAFEDARLRVSLGTLDFAVLCEPGRRMVEGARRFTELPELVAVPDGFGQKKSAAELNRAGGPAAGGR
jgi:hypothetical protein